jgi:biopolymer transport protein ExbD
MRRPFRDRSASATHGAGMPNMTPMVDVVMVILVFFMATAAIMGPEWLLKTALPARTVNAAAAPAEIVPVRVTLAADGTAKIVSGVDPASRREIATTLDALPAAMGALAGERGAANLAVTFDAADDVPYVSVVRAHEACAKAGITRVGVPGK